MRGGPRLAPKQQRLPEPRIDDDVTGLEIDRSIKNELRTLSKDNAKGVGQHLVMVARLLDVDIHAARAHAETAVRRAGRVAAVRETRGLVAYREGDYALALSEFRTARRLTGSQHLLPLMVDCERGLGRPERALELAGSPEARTLGKSDRIEMLLVCSGIRRDMGHLDAAVVLLEVLDLDAARRDPWSPRLFYAYADALLARGDRERARAWFAEAVDADVEHETDAAERLDEIDGVVFVDLGGDDEADAERVGVAEHVAPEQSAAEAGPHLEAELAAQTEPADLEQSAAEAGPHPEAERVGVAEHVAPEQSAAEAGPHLEAELAAQTEPADLEQSAAEAGPHPEAERVGVAKHVAPEQSAAEAGPHPEAELAAQTEPADLEQSAAEAGPHPEAELAAQTEPADLEQSAAEAGPHPEAEPAGGTEASAPEDHAPTGPNEPQR